MSKMQHIDPGSNRDEDFPLSQGKIETSNPARRYGPPETE